MKTKILGVIILLVVVSTMGIAQSAFGYGYDFPNPNSLFGTDPSAKGKLVLLTVTIYYVADPSGKCFFGTDPNTEDVAVSEMHWGIRREPVKKLSAEVILKSGTANKDDIACSIFPLPDQQSLCQEILGDLEESHPPICIVEDTDIQRSMISAFIKKEIVEPLFGPDAQFTAKEAASFAYEVNEDAQGNPLGKPLFLSVDLEIRVQLP